MIRGLIISLLAAIAFILYQPVTTLGQQDKKPKKPKKVKRGNPSSKNDGKNKTSGRPEPPKDATLAKYGIYAKNAPNPTNVEPRKPNSN